MWLAKTGTHTHTQREDGHVNMEAIGVTLPQTKEHLGPPNQEETRKVPLLEASEGTQPCRHYDYGLLLPRTWEKINLCYFKPPSSLLLGVPGNYLQLHYYL